MRAGWLISRTKDIRAPALYLTLLEELEVVEVLRFSICECVAFQLYAGTFHRVAAALSAREMVPHLDFQATSARHQVVLIFNETQLTYPW
jgi:hypothetical protein